ncbi:MAG: PDGLE domain-containing protein [Nocardioides sp.]|nr:PDGLE domain-containing protein [Nocardioides sp.]
MKLKTFLLTGLVVALLIAGVASFYASSHPDGLVFVAEKTGFLDSATDHGAADGPLAGYQAKGVDNPRLAGGLAGVLGALAVLLIGGGLFWTIRRRDRDEEPEPRQHADSH